MALTCPPSFRSSASPWRPLEQEFDAWTAEGQVARFWWRDDDATSPSPALDRLLRLAGDAPLTIAVVPQDMVPSLADRLRDAASVSLIQHGIGHTDHAALGRKRIELGGTAPLPVLEAGLAAGRTKLEDAFGPQFLPVLAPPWNRIAPALLPLLPACGFRAVSGFGPRRAREAAPGLAQINTHADPIDWAAQRCRPAEIIVEGLAAHLAAQRRGSADADEPVGLLTHHLLEDPAVDRLIGGLGALIAEHPAARWISLAEVLPA